MTNTKTDVCVCVCASGLIKWDRGGSGINTENK